MLAWDCSASLLRESSNPIRDIRSLCCLYNYLIYVISFKYILERLDMVHLVRLRVRSTDGDRYFVSLFTNSK